MRSVLIVFLLAALAITSNSQVNRKDSTLQQGFQKIANGDYPGAIREFNRILRSDPNEFEALKGLAEAKFQMGDSVTALQDIEKACTINPKFAAAWFIKGEILNSQGKYADALAAYKKAQAIDPTDAESFRGVVLSTFYTGAEKEAFTLVENAIQKNSKTSINYYIRGVLYNSKGKYSKAIDDFDKALSYSTGKNEFNIYLNRGVCFLNLEEPEPAETDLTKAIGLKPDNASAWHSRGRVYYFLKQYDKAISDFNESLELNPNSDVTLYNLAMAYFRSEDNKNACEYFHKSCSMGNKNACKMVLMNCAEIKK